MSSAKDPRVTSTDGHAPDAEGAAPGPISPVTGQHESYWILTAEERAKGFVRPVRTSYVHVGIRPVHPTRKLTEKERELHGDEFALYEEFPAGGTAIGRFWTALELKSGCNGRTSMSREIAETYARQPSFYGKTFCVQCRDHLPVGERGEFVWEGTTERVGT